MKFNLGYLVLFTVVASSISNIVFQEKANAWVEICNKGSTRIEKLAVVYKQDIGDAYYDWKSTGTDRFSMNPGECRRIYDGDLENSGKQFGYHVEGEGWKTSGDHKYCIATDKDFEFYKSSVNAVCGKVITLSGMNYNTKFANFRFFDTTGRNYTMNLTN
jgi:uncharacterized membrane protein